MAIQVVPPFLQNAAHSAAIFRQSASAAFLTGGILGLGEMAVTQQGTPNMSVVLAAGRAKIVGNSVSAVSGFSWTTQAMYDVLNDAPLTLTVTASNASLARIDAVYTQVQDSFYSGATNTAVAGVAAGVPSASPAIPAIPTNCILLGFIAVAAGTVSIVNANLSQTVSVATLISGKPGTIPVIPTSVLGAAASVTATGKVQWGSSSFVSVNGCFTTAADKYDILIDISGMSVPGQMAFSLRSAGADNTSTNYDWQAVYGSASAPGSSGLAANTYWQLTAGGTGSHSIRITVHNPAQTSIKRAVSQSVDYTGGAAPTISLLGLGFRSGISFDGFTLFAVGGGTFAGNIAIEAHLN